MKFDSIKIKNALPVKKFEAENLGSLVFLAGPNGIGKSRLIQFTLNYIRNPSVNSNASFIISATSKEEKNAWRGKEKLDLSVQSDVQLFQQTLRKNRRRRNFTSSVLYYESNRQIINLQPLQSTWEVNDPYEENLSWDFSFTPLSGRFQDTLHSLFKKVQSQKSSIASKAIQLKEAGKNSMNLDFSDPLAPFKAAFKQLLAPKILLGIDIRRNALRIEDEDREINEKALSSGEREVLNIVFDFLLRNPSDCMVFFDEPELHLHPELVNRLLNTLRTIGEGNQFIFCTHSAELLSSSLDNTVIFIQPQAEPKQNQAVSVSVEHETYDALKSIGQSIGVVSLGKKIVLIEGRQSSLDKKTYLQIIKAQFPDLVLVPCEGKYTIQSFSHIANTVLDRTVWGVDFYLLSDRDAFPKEIAHKVQERGLNNKVKSLQAYHLENYFLDEVILSEIFQPMEDQGSWLSDPEQINIRLKAIAEKQVGYCTALTVSKLLRDTVGNVDLMLKGCNEMSCDDLITSFSDRANEELKRVADVLSSEYIDQKTKEYHTLYVQSLSSSTWKKEIPGKPVFRKFCKEANMDETRLKTLYIKKSLSKENSPFQEIIDIFADFSSQ